MRVRYTPQAKCDLAEIFPYIAQDNPVRASTFVRELRDKLDILREHQLGKPGRVYGTRELVLHKHYVAVYRVHANEVHVLTVLHTAQQRS